MNFSFSDEQEELRQYARDFLASNLPITRVAEIADSPSGWAPEIVDEIAQMGWFDPDLGFLDRAVLFEEAGYALLAGSWFSAVALVRPLISDDDPLAGRIDSGAARVTFAWAENDRHASVLDIPLVQARTVGEDALSGTKVLVPDAAAATTALVAVKDGERVALFEVDLVPDNVRINRTLDRTRRFAEVTLDGLPAHRVALAGEEIDLPRLHAQLLTALACEAVGVARRALDLAVEYAKTREQFGKIIGTYQGVSHRLSEAFKEIELARSLAYRAAWTVETGVAHEGGHYEIVRAAKAQAGEAAVFAAEQAIQVFGGIGITWDHPIHRWFKRAMLLSAWEGNAAHQRSKIADVLIEQRSL